jgi:hypothetical protein
MNQPKKRGPKKGEGGRPKGPEKVKMTVRILPSTRAKLGRNPGKKIDLIFNR